MATKIEVCNNALRQLARNRVTDIDNPTTNEEKIVADVFDIVADEVMSARSWTSVMKRASLVATVNEPEFGFNIEYQLPTSPKCLHVVDINQCSDGAEYVIEGDKLLTDLTEVQIRYRARITTVENWDVGLTLSVIDRLTAKLAQVLTGNETKAQYYQAIYVNNLDINCAQNNQQGSKQRQTSSDLTDCR